MTEISDKPTEYLQGVIAVLKTTTTEENDAEHYRHHETCNICRAASIAMELAERLMKQATEALSKEETEK